MSGTFPSMIFFENIFCAFDLGFFFLLYSYYSLCLVFSSVPDFLNVLYQDGFVVVVVVRLNIDASISSSMSSMPEILSSMTHVLLVRLASKVPVPAP